PAQRPTSRFGSSTARAGFVPEAPNTKTHAVNTANRRFISVSLPLRCHLCLMNGKAKMVARDAPAHGDRFSGLTAERIQRGYALESRERATLRYEAGWRVVSSRGNEAII